MTTRLTLICHAATAATRAARFPLDEPIGIPAEAPLPVLADAVAQAGHRFAAPEGRARASAALFGLPFADDDGLRDLDAGRWAGQAIAGLAAAEPERLAAWMSDPEAAPHGGESIAGLVARMARWMDARAAEGGRVVGVTHPAPLRAAMVAALGAGPGCFWRIEAAPWTAARFSHDGRRWTLAGLAPAGQA